MAVIPARIHDDALGGICKVTYDYDVHGGAIGTITLPLDLPDNAIVHDGLIDVVTAPTSDGSATIALGLNTTTDLKTATAIASYSGIVAMIPVGTAATAVKLTADRSLQLTIGAAALTAGKLNIFMNYYISE